MRWLLVLLLACLLCNGLHGWLGKTGLGKPPVDFSLRVRGCAWRVWRVPLASPVVLTVLAMLVGLLI